MEKLYFYIEDVDGGLVVDEYYMNTKFDNADQKLMFVGTAEDVENYIYWLCNTDII